MPISNTLPRSPATVERAMLLDVSIVGDPAYRAGGVWLAGDEPYLPPRLAVLAEQFDRAPPLGARRPPKVVRIDLCRRARQIRAAAFRVYPAISAWHQ
jgi:hypothetical protein